MPTYMKFLVGIIGFFVVILLLFIIAALLIPEPPPGTAISERKAFSIDQCLSKDGDHLGLVWGVRSRLVNPDTMGILGTAIGPPEPMPAKGGKEYHPIVMTITNENMLGQRVSNVAWAIGDTDSCDYELLALE